ncbi:MAG: hypothetical protein HUU20_16815 [Pirellulales bacterium]|nr:hypothetical protein [Pirellulales bacterium]
MAAWAEVFTARAHGNNCPAFVLSPDGKRLYTSGPEQHDDETDVIKAWDVLGVSYV